MKIGYSFWGYLGDTKYDSDGNIASTPDGNAFYSWSIIYQLLSEGCEVVRVMPNRDYVGYGIEKEDLFSWCQHPRLMAYKEMTNLYKVNTDWANMSKEELFAIWDNKELYKCDVILHEWRMLVVGRNDSRTKSFVARGDLVEFRYQPDLFIQNCLLEYCVKYEIPIILFDLDYKLSLLKDVEEIRKVHSDIFILELGYKHKYIPYSYNVEIPFSFGYINTFDVKDNPKNSLVYVGNRYERDWCIDKYIPTEIDGVYVYGNWKESGRDSEIKWPNINFKDRLQTKGMYDVYSNSIATVLLAKEEYTDNMFMTARIIESIFYGCVPLFIEEYGKECINKYAGIYSQELTVHSKSDIINRIEYFRNNNEYRKKCIMYLREHLKFMDVKYFVQKVLSIIDECKD